MKEDYLRHVREAGFERVELVEEKQYGSAAFGPDPDAAAKTTEAIRSVKVRAFKPAR
jgi:hypothetical protein